MFMKTTIENLEFPSNIKQKIKMKVSMGNLSVNFISGHLINIDKTNLSIKEPHKIIAKNNTNILIAYVYDNEGKIYLPNNNVIVSLTKYISILNIMNKY